MNADTDEILAELATFQAATKFQRAESELPVPNRAPPALAMPLQAALNRCARDLASLVKSGASPAQLSMCIQTSLRSVEQPFDKEDREYLAHHYDQLGKCVGIDMGSLLSRWLHGYLLLPLFFFFVSCFSFGLCFFCL